MEHDNGQKFGALFDGFDAVNQRLDRIESEHGKKFDVLEQRLDRIEMRFDVIETDVGDIKKSLVLLKSIASDYENRLYKVEKVLMAHIESHQES